MKTLTTLVDELKGLSLWEIQRMIERKKEEMMSGIEENTEYVRAIGNELSTLTYRMDNIAVEEGKQRQAVQQTILKHVTTV